MTLLYKPGRYRELWFCWQGKPLLLCDPAQASKEISDFFTLRKAHWPFELVNTHNEWHWEATYPQVYSFDRDPSRPEQVNVSVGQNLNQKTGRVEMMSTGHARGRSFHDGHVDPRPDAYQYGLNFEEQWQRALALDPNVVFITGWNEWIAMQLNQKDGPAVFCDEFNLEFSRDVEMMKAGYGDSYYVQMAANIRRFKGMAAAPEVSGAKTIDISGPFESMGRRAAGVPRPRSRHAAPGLSRLRGQPLYCPLRPQRLSPLEGGPRRPKRLLLRANRQTHYRLHRSKLDVAAG